MVLSSLRKQRLRIRSRQTIKEFLISRRKAIIDFIARCPERVAAEAGEISELEDGVVGGDGLESDV